MTERFSLDLFGMGRTLHSMHSMRMTSQCRLKGTKLRGMHAGRMRLTISPGTRSVWTRTHAVHMAYLLGSFVGVEILHLGLIVDLLRERSRWWTERHESPAHARRVV